VTVLQYQWFPCHRASASACHSPVARVPPRQSRPHHHLVMFFSRSRKKKNSPSNSAPANGLASRSQTSQLPQLTESQSPLETQQTQPLYPWSVHTPLLLGQSPSPFPRYSHALSTTATAASELFLFGGRTYDPICNDLYVISTRDFSTTLLKTSGDVPSPRYGHTAVLTDTTLLIWGGKTDSGDQNAQNPSNDDSFYLLNLGTSDPFHVKTCFS
jgi:hypothetical protein